MAFPLKNKDTGPVIRGTLKNGTGAAIDLTGATVLFSMRSQSGATVIEAQPALIVDAEAGVVEYEWTAEDTDDPGIYEAEFRVTLSDGNVETIPNDGYIPIKISERI